MSRDEFWYLMWWMAGMLVIGLVVCTIIAVIGTALTGGF